MNPHDVLRILTRSAPTASEVSRAWSRARAALGVRAGDLPTDTAQVEWRGHEVLVHYYWDVAYHYRGAWDEAEHYPLIVAIQLCSPHGLPIGPAVQDDLLTTEMVAEIEVLVAHAEAPPTVEPEEEDPWDVARDVLGVDR